MPLLAICFSRIVLEGGGRRGFKMLGRESYSSLKKVWSSFGMRSIRENGVGRILCFVYTYGSHVTIVTA